MVHAKIAILFFIVSLFSPLSAFAFESTSTSFEIHAAALESISGSSTSATFRLQSAGGQLSTGTSTATSEKVYSGILYWLHGLFTPQYEQIHFRWRDDNGWEATSTWATIQDAAYTGFPKTTNKRLRFEVTNSGWTRGAAPTFQLQYATTTDCTSGSYTTVPTDTSYAWQVVDSTHFADGVATTNVSGCSPSSDCLTDANNVFVAGQMKDTGNTTGAITLASNNFTEVEFNLQATTNAVSGTTYCFRLLNSNPLYTRYASAVVAGFAGQGALTSSTYDTGVASGAAYNSIIWNGVLNSGNRVKLQLATSNSTGGPWNYYGPGAACNGTTFYEPAAGVAMEIGCPTQHNNHRYFRYSVQLCSLSDCSSGGSTTPRVDDIVINWSP